MSNINANAVDATYPIAGQDNNSQGFRNNFGAIKDALAIARDEIGDLQAKAVVIAELGTNTLTAIENDLNTSLLKNGVHKQFYPEYNPRGTAQEVTTIDLTNGPVQSFTVGNGDEFNFSWGNWPQSDVPAPWPIDAPRRCASVRLMFRTATGTAAITFGGTVTDSVVSGAVIPATGVTLPLAVNSTHYTVVEAWTVDEGDTIFIHNIGTF